MKLYGIYSRDDLDREYSPSSMIPDVETYIRLYEAKSAVARARLTSHLDRRYGKAREQVLDIFPAARDGAPVQVFIHGGYWQELSKNESAASAPDFVAAGATFVALNYGLAPKYSLDRIVAQTREAVAWLYRNIAKYGGDPERIYVSGHSAGAQLALMLLATDWQATFEIPDEVIKGVCAVSGVYDLEPLRLTYVNDALGLDEEAAARNSPIRHIPERACPLVLAVGERETREFRRQTFEFAKAWEKAGHRCRLLDVPGVNHFDIILDLGDRSTALGRAVLEQMNLLPG